MGISSAEFSKIYEGDTKHDFQVEMCLKKPCAEVGNTLSRDCGVKLALGKLNLVPDPSVGWWCALKQALCALVPNLCLIVRGKGFFQVIQS